MKYGMFMMPSHPPERELYAAHQWDLDCLQLADELGFSEAWIGEHFTSPWEPIPAPDLMIAQALMRTKNIKLCTGVHLLPYHHPAELGLPRGLPRPHGPGPVHVRHRLQRPADGLPPVRRGRHERPAPAHDPRVHRHHPQAVGKRGGRSSTRAISGTSTTPSQCWTPCASSSSRTRSRTRPSAWPRSASAPRR